MFQNETTRTHAVSFQPNTAALGSAAIRRRTNLVSRYLPVPLVFGGVAATIAWMGLVAWWIFEFLRWSAS